MTIRTVRFNPLAVPFVGLLVVFWLLAVCCAPAAEEKDKPLTNGDILKMLEAKISESVILAKIRTSKVKFDSSTDAIIDLHKKGIGEKVLSAMVDPKGDSPEGAKSPDLNPSGAAKPPDAPAAPPAATPGAKPSALSYGTATGLVKRGVTTQLELLELFGGPSTMTTDKDGTEVWMYDKTTSSVSGTSKQTGKQARQSEASAMAAALGIPLIGAVAAAKGSEKERSEQEIQSENTRTSSTTTFTFIIKFNADKTVKEYSVRQAKF